MPLGFHEADSFQDSCIMQHCVLKASGHVDRFNDFMVKDVKVTWGFQSFKIVAREAQALRWPSLK